MSGTFMGVDINVIAVGAGAAVLLITLLLVAVLRRGKKSHIASAQKHRGKVVQSSVVEDGEPQATLARPASTDVAAEKPMPGVSLVPPVPSVIAASDPDSWTGGGSPGSVADGGYRVRGGESATSVFKLPMKPGQTAKCSFSVRAGADATQGDNSFYIGPLILGGNGEILQWWVAQPSITKSEGLRVGAVSLIAPAGAACAVVGLHGPTAEGSNGSVDLVSASLTIA